MESIPDSIREAVAAGEFQLALVLWQRYSDILGEQVRGTRLQEQTVTELRDLLDWTRTVALVTNAQARDMIVQHHAACRVAQAYGLNSQNE